MSAPTTINGKRYEQLTSFERATLEHDDPEIFARMRGQSLRDEATYEQEVHAAFHAGALTHEGVVGLRAQLETGELSYSQATSIVRALPRQHGAA
jgi:hypothetical protein